MSKCVFGHERPQVTCPACIVPAKKITYSGGTGVNKIFRGDLHVHGNLTINEPNLLERIEQLEALLREAECPNADGVNVKCIDGTLNTITLAGYELSAMTCDWCAKRDELLNTKGEG